MKKICNIGRMVGLALMLILCFSTNVFPEEYFFTIVSGRTSAENDFMGLGNNNYIPFKENSYEIDVKEIKNPAPKPMSVELAINTVMFHIQATCSDCGLYLKITDPEGKIVFDSSTPEEGFLKPSNTSQNFPLNTDKVIPGKYTVWFKPSAPNTIRALEVSIRGIPKQ